MIAQNWLRLLRSRSGMVGFVLVLMATLIGIFGPMLTGSPTQIGAEAFCSPGASCLLGTDDLGRDMFVRMAHGARVSLLVGFAAAAFASVLGIVIGSISGFVGGKVDELFMRIAEAFQVVPQFFLAILIVALFGPSLTKIVLVIGILSWADTARIVRAEFLKLRGQDYVVAAQLAGASRAALIFSEILPNALPPVIVTASLQIASAILTEASLSFLGLGDPDQVSWGQLLFAAQPFLNQAWWMAIFPGIAILVTTLGFNLLGDGLNDVLDPRQKGSTR
ncbi:ABC transporter permease [Devosia faecipullorum]|uniref:ABC transporter permease n=1 Tax=Devosia faecipullorum TaxID=2755039 RepID=UPI00187B1251|nr:ABC transporter permease [Devosia faecipullorum]MBE7732827.1 ABC transporter permease [Devosia faecipullorum]